MEKVEVGKTLIAMADALAEQVETERKNGFLILIDEEGKTRVRTCCTFENLTNFIGALMGDYAARLKDIGCPKEIVEGFFKSFAETAIESAFEEVEENEA